MGKYTKELKEEVIRLKLKEGRSQKSLEAEYGLGQGTVRNWIKSYREECTNNPEKAAESKANEEYLELKRKYQELEKENLFLKKAAAFFAKEM